MSILFVDFETRSTVDLNIVGTANYVRHPTTQVLLLAWALDDAPVRVWEPQGKKAPLPKELHACLMNPAVQVCAWNANFERNVFSHVLGIDIPLDRWLDPMVHCRFLSLPGALSKAGAILGLSEDQAKLKHGRALIKRFCLPADLGGETTLFGISEPSFHDWRTDKKLWQEFRDYNIRDVEAERTIYNMVKHLPLPEQEVEAYKLDQIINDRGLPVNVDLVSKALTMAQNSKSDWQRQLLELTKLQNPDSTDQMLEWVKSQGYCYNSLRKEFVALALTGKNLSPLAREALIVRQNSAKSAYKKFDTIKEMVSTDGFLRNQFVFGGASRTMRWSGSGVQFQNLPRPPKKVEKNLHRAIEIIENMDSEAAVREFGSVLEMITGCIRSVFQAPPGYVLVVCDLSAIENRVLGWLAQCEGILEVFTKHLDPYVAFAAKMYKKPYDELFAEYKAGNSHKRQIAKPAVLGCLGENTLVLTHHGWTKIIDVSLRDELWDGYTWVKHAGVVYQGVKEVLCWNNIEITPDHEILVSTEWKTAREASHHAQPRTRTVNTFDILNAGPNHRFTILTSKGTMIVHNCGYGLGGGEEKENSFGDVVKTGLWGYAEGMGVSMTQDEAHTAVQVFRESYPELLQLWKGLEVSAKNAILDRKKTQFGPITFDTKTRKSGENLLRIFLPSGRPLHYFNARVERNVTQNREYIAYEGIGHGVGATKKGNLWGKVFTYGGKLAENIVQAVSRDILLNGMFRAHEAGLNLVGHVHDEIVCLEREEEAEEKLAILKTCMKTAPEWAADLPLDAAGFAERIYRK